MAGHDECREKWEKLFESQNECEVWRAEHDGRINELWRRQVEELNPSYLSRLNSHSNRIVNMERKMAVMVGIAALVGSALGAVVNYAVAMAAASG